MLASDPGVWLHQLAFYVQELQLAAAVGLLLRCILSAGQASQDLYHAQKQHT